MCQSGRYQTSNSHTTTTCTACHATSGYAYTTTPKLGAFHENECTVRMCPKGMHIDRQGECAPCPYGQYQDQVNQASCKTCPDGKATTSTTAASYMDAVSDCNAKCGRGRYLAN